jgi:methyl-accepting chemotaxis protein
MEKLDEKLNHKGLFALDTVKKKMIISFLVISIINIVAFLGFEVFTTFEKLGEEALDKSYAYGEHIEKIISPMGIQQKDKLQEKVTELLEKQYKLASYIGVLNSNLEFVAHTDKSKIGTSLKIEAAEKVINTNQYVSTTIEAGKNKEYISIVPFYNRVIQGTDAVSSATTVANVTGLVVVSMDVQAMLMNLKIKIIRIIIIGLILFSLSLIISITLARTITNPLMKIRSFINGMAEGDLTKIIEINSRDELAALSNDINTTNLALRKIILQIKATEVSLGKYSNELYNSTEQLAEVSEEINHSMDEVAVTTNMQSKGLAEVVSVVSDFANGLDNINARIKVVDTNSSSIRTVAEAGSTKINELLLNTSGVQDSFETVNSNIELLSYSISQINSITETMNKVAEQTNLLALNASIEAARAGEEGRGFSIVAKEIRNLSEQTKGYSLNISKLIKDITERTRIVTETTSDAIGKVDKQGYTISETVSIFKDIVSQINVVIPEIQTVADTVNSNVIMKDNMLSSVQSISAFSEEMSSAAEEVAVSIKEQTKTIIHLKTLSDNLNQKSKDMSEEILKFKI